MAGDFSPLTIEAARGAPRAVPPALLLAMAVGLGSMDMPVPSVIEWEWLNWKFPRPVHAGDTVYARWTLTQKRPPAGGATSSIVVWRVDVHTADGAMCAEGEVGATVRRQVAGVPPRPRPAEPRVAAPALPSPGAAPVPAAATQAAAAQRRSRRRRRPGGNGSAPAAETPAAASTEPAASAAPAAAKPVERTSAAPRRRRRRRPASASGARDGEGEGGSPAAPAPEAPGARPDPAPAPAPAQHGKSPLSRVIGRLRRT